MNEIKLLTNIEKQNEKNIISTDEKNIKKLIKIANEKKVRRIYIKDKSSEFILLKIKGVWKTISKYSFNIYCIKKMNLKLDANYCFADSEFLSNKFDVTLKNDVFFYENEENEIDLKLSFLLKEDFYIDVAEDDKTSVSRLIIGYEYRNAVKKLIDDSKKSTNILGLNNSKVKEGISSFTIINSEGGIIIIDDSENEKYEILTFSRKDKKSDSIFFAKRLCENVNNRIKNILTAKPTLKKKDIFYSVFAFVIVCLILWLTFTKIFSSGSISESFEILFSKTSWGDPWIYILFINFVFTYFMAFFMAFFIDVVISNKKFNFGSSFNMFLSLQIRSISLFLTGNLFISMFLWGLYLNKTQNIRISSLIATVGVANIIKTFAVLINSIIYMIPATIYLSGSFEDSWQAFYLLFLSYGGLFYSIFQDAIIGMVIFFPILHPIYSYFKINVFTKWNPSFNTIEKTNSDLESLTNAMKGAIKNKQRIIRTTTTTLLIVFFEAIETVSTFQLVENYWTSNATIGMSFTDEMNKAHYYSSLFAISGCRMMSTYIRHFPLLNVIPGQGVGITDYFMKSINEIIVMKEHSIPYSSSTEILEEVNSFALNVTFITRFFNFYLTKILATIFACYAVFNILHKKRKIKMSH